MTQQQQLPPGIDEALSYMKHQAGKGLESLAALMQRTEQDWARCLETMSEPQASFAPEGEWNAKNVLRHFLESTVTVNQQVQAAAQGRPIDWPHANAQLNNQPARDETRTISQLRANVEALLSDTVALVKQLPEGDGLQTRFTHPFFGDLDVKEWVAFQRIHSMDHIGQIEKIKADAAYPAA